MDRTRVARAEAMITAPPRWERADGHITISSAVSDRAPLWFSVQEEFSDLLSDRADHVLISLLMPAMKEGRDLHIGGTVTDALLHNANTDLQALLRMENPEFHAIRVTADSVAAPTPRALGVATGFSGGVDSFSTLVEYFWSVDAPRSLRVTHLLNNNVGAHGHSEAATALWRARRAPLERIAVEIGLPFVAVDSNLDEHYPRIGFVESVTMRNAAVPHLLGAGIGHLHFASSLPFSHVHVTGTGDISLLDTMLVPMLSTAGVTITSANSGQTRVQKTLSLIDVPEARHLDVCIDGDPTRTRNCSACPKCMRTMLTLEVGGYLEKFCPDTFSYDRYSRRRNDFVAEVLTSDDPFHQEIREYAAEVGWQWSTADRVRAVRTALKQRILRAARAIAGLPVLRPLRRVLGRLRR
ncbi:hypothetical protein [Microbacterium soli]|uniref:7-cyano-7-deazaguanine synthase n=1 Tax=Microbacterium soli TaxID=446075 RepID=A0ABP7MUN3_9MICO